MTYLQLVNNVLKRLRERTVSTVGETSYSTLISMLINDAKQEVEQAWDWSALRTTLSASTTSGIFNYELNGFKNNGKMLDVVNDTSNFFMRYETATKFNNYFLNATPATGEPRYYSFNGVSDDGDTLVDVYPIPDGVYALRFNAVVRQADLSADTDEILCPSKPVELLAYAKAVEERGEDGGTASISAYNTANRALNDALSLDQAKHPEELIWTAP
jgi:hypothetical protein